MQVRDDVLHIARRCNDLGFAIQLMTASLLNIALFQHLKCQDQRISKTWKSLRGGPIFYI